MEQRSPEWFKARVGVITGSRVGSILGVNPYATREDVMRDMVREHFGAEREFNGNAATRHGERMESVAQAFYEENSGNKVDQVGLVTHDTYDWLGASPDGLVGLDGGIEIKCPYWAKEPYSVYDKLSYLAQVHHVMEVCDLAWLDFVCYINPDSFSIERVTRDPNWLTDNFEKLESFRNEYVSIVSSEADSAKYLAGKEQIISTPRAERFEQLFQLIKAAESEVAPLREEYDSLKSELGEEFGSFQVGRVKLQRIEKKGAVDSKSLYKDINLEGILGGVGKTLDDYRKEPVISFNVSFLKDEK